MGYEIFAELPHTHILKLAHLSIVIPALLAAVIAAIMTRKSQSWWPVAGLVLLLVGNCAYVEFAPRLYFADRWPAPLSRSGDIPKFIARPIPESSR